MTLAALLEELREVDPGEWDNLTMWNVNKELPETSPLSMFIIQGCIQRACEMREWDLRQDQWVIKMDGQNVVYHYATIEKGIAETGEPFEHEGRGKSQAEALLAAYVAAV